MWRTGVAIAAAVALATAARATKLEPNVAQFGYVYDEAYNDYTFSLTTAELNDDVRFTLTPYSGDPDLYVSTAGVPRHNNATWRSTEFEMEEVTVSHTDKDFKQNWYISVRGYQSDDDNGPTGSTYTLMASSLEANDTEVLPLGSVTWATASPTEFAYFSVDLSKVNKDVAVVVSPTSGETGVYATVNAASGKWLYPRRQCEKRSGSTGLCVEWSVDPTSYKYGSVNAGADLIKVPSRDFTNSDVLVVGVYCLPNAGYHCTYTVRAEDMEVVEDLPIGTSLWENTAAQAYSQWRITLTNQSLSDANGLTVSTSNFVGTTGIYACADGSGCSGDPPTPTNSSHTWAQAFSDTFETYLHIDYKDLPASCRASLDQGKLCHVYVGVQAHGLLGSYYYIQAAVSGSKANAPRIDVGQPVAGYVPANAFDYYTIPLPVGGGLATFSVSLTVPAGDAELLVNIGAEGAPFPSPGHADYSTYVLNGDGSVIIGPGGPSVRRALAAPLAWAPAVAGAEPSAEERAQWETRRGAARKLAGVGNTYCAATGSCVLRVAVAGTANGAEYTLSSAAAGTTVVPLAAGEPTGGATVAGNYSYYSFDVGALSPSGQPTIRIELSALSGDPDLYATVGDPSKPSDLPSTTNHMWYSAYLDDDLISVPSTDPNYCTACVILIAVHSFGRDPSTYSITASLSGGSDLPETVGLVPSVPYFGSVQNGGSDIHSNYAFFTFRSSGLLQQAQPVSFEWTVGEGDVAVYVTNQFDPANPSQAALPTQAGKGTSAVQWAVEDGQRSLSISSSDPHFDTSKPIFTVGVLGTGEANTVSSFWLTGLKDDGIETLLPGVPSTNHLINAGANRRFEFEIASAAKDVVIEVSTRVGAVAVALTSLPVTSPAGGSGAGSFPACSGFGSSFQCTNAVWVADQTAASQFNVSHASPCVATSTGVTVTSLCKAPTAFRTGTWSFAVYGLAEAQFDVVMRSGEDHTLLLDGDSVMGTAADDLVCAAADRDPSTHACKTTNPTTAKHRYVQWFRATTPATEYGDAVITVQHRCGNTTGLGCGPGIAVYAASCTSDDASCSLDSIYPTEEQHDYSMTVGTTTLQGELHIPAHSCTGTAGKHAACEVFLGVYSACAEGLLGCRPADFFINLDITGSATVQVIDDDCFAYGNQCRVPGAAAEPSYASFFLGDLRGVTGVSTLVVDVQACESVFNAYVCKPGAGSSCKTPERPASGNSDLSGSTKNAGQVSFPIAPSSLASQQFYLGVDAPITPEERAALQAQAAAWHGAAGTPSSFTSGSLAFEVLVRSQNSGHLVFGTNALTVAGEVQPNGQALVYLRFDTIKFIPTGASTGRLVTNATVTTFLLPANSQGLPVTNAVLDTACGLPLAYQNTLLQPWGTGARQNFTSMAAGPLTFANVPKGTYYFGAIISCDKQSKCLLPGAKDVPVIAALNSEKWTYDGPPAPTPTPNPNPAPNHPPNGGAIAGGIIATLAVIAMGAGAWYCWRRRNSPVPAGYDQAGFFSSSDGGAGYEEFRD